MTMSRPLRKLAFTAHVTSSVAWLGAVGGFLALSLWPVSRASRADADAYELGEVTMRMELATELLENRGYGEELKKLLKCDSR